MGLTADINNLKEWVPQLASLPGTEWFGIEGGEPFIVIPQLMFGGALINTYFIDHYQDLARAHFTIRRLEREYGEGLVREAYHSLRVN
jgi:hypothetical protein